MLLCALAVANQVPALDFLNIHSPRTRAPRIVPTMSNTSPHLTCTQGPWAKTKWTINNFGWQQKLWPERNK